MKKYFFPFLALIIGVALMTLLRNYVHVYFKDTLTIILLMLVLFGFGWSLNDSHSSFSTSWFRKILAAVLAVVTALLYTGVIKATEVHDILKTAGVTTPVYYMLMIFFGYLFG